MIRKEKVYISIVTSQGKTQEDSSLRTKVWQIARGYATKGF